MTHKLKEFDFLFRGKFHKNKETFFWKSCVDVKYSVHFISSTKLFTQKIRFTFSLLNKQKKQESKQKFVLLNITWLCQNDFALNLNNFYFL